MVARENLLKLIISSFDYGRDGIARVVLAKALTAAPLVGQYVYFHTAKITVVMSC